MEALEKMLTSEESSSSKKQDVSERVVDSPHREHHRSTHIRRHSAPDQISSNTRTNQEEDDDEQLAPTSKKQLKCASTSSLMNLITEKSRRFSLSDKLQLDVCSNTSINTTTTTDTVDSFELALAIGAKNSQFISEATRELLHRLFVKVAGNLIAKILILPLTNHEINIQQELPTNFNQTTQAIYESF